MRRLTSVGALVAVLAACPNPSAREDGRAVISGRVELVDLPGLNDLSRVRVDLGRGEGGITPDGNGEFEFTDVEPDAYNVTVDYVGGLSPTASRSAYQRLQVRAVARAGAAVHVGTLRPLRALGSVSGAVDMPDGDAGDEARVVLTLDDGRTLEAVTEGRAFTIAGVPVGKHRVSATAVGFARGAAQPSCALDVDVGEEGAVASVTDLALGATRAAFSAGLGEVANQRGTTWFLAGSTLTVHVDSGYARNYRHWSSAVDSGGGSYRDLPGAGIPITVAAEGRALHHFQFTDGCGFESGVYDLLLVRDTTAPVPVLVLAGGAAVVTSTSLELEVRSDDEVSTELEQRLLTCNAADACGAQLGQAGFGPFRPFELVGVPGGDGEKLVALQLRDLSGNTSGLIEARILLDTSPPEVQSIVVGDGSGTIRSAATNVTILATGAVDMRMDDVPGLAELPYGAFAPTSPFTFTPDDGSKTLYVQLRDAAGNETGEIPATVLLSTAGTVRGTVQVEGAGSANDVQVVVGGRTVNAVAGADVRRGTFEVTGVAQGTTELVAYVIGADAMRYRTARRVVTVVADAVADIGEVSVELARGSLAGLVLLAGASSSNGAAVTAEDISDPGNTHTVVTGSTGRYVFTQIPVGTYAVAAAHPDYVRAALGNWSVQDGMTTEVPPNALTRADGSGVRINGGAGYTNDRVVMLSLRHDTATQYLASEDPAFAGATPTAFANGTDLPFTITSAGDGEKFIYVHFLSTPPVDDQASIILDETAPDAGRSSVLIELGRTFTRESSGLVSLSLVGVDETAGVAHMYIGFTADFAAATDLAYATVAGPLAVSDPTIDGQKTVFAWFEDRAGNRSLSPVTDTIYLDREPPSQTELTVAGATGGFVQSSAITLRMGATDACLEGYPGCAADVAPAWQVQVANRDDFVGSDWRPFPGTATTPGDSAWFLPPGEGERTVYVRYRDEAGNVSAPSSRTVSVDTTPPVILDVRLAGGARFTSNADVTLAITADGATRFRTAVDALPSGAFTALPVPPGYLVTLASVDNVEQQVFVEVADDAGNSVVVPVSITLDRSPPATPRNLSVGARTTAAFVDWDDVRETTGARVVEYAVEVYAICDNCIPQEGGPPPTPVKDGVFTASEGMLLDLPPYARLSFRVRARDEAGNTSPAASLEASVGFTSSLVEPGALAAGESDGADPVFFRGFVLVPAGPTTLDICDARAGPCTGRSFRRTSRDLLAEGSVPAGSNAQSFAYAIAVEGSHAWFFHIRQEGTAYALYALVFDVLTEPLGNMADLSNWTLLSLGPTTNPGIVQMAATSNGSVLALLIEGSYSRVYFQRCALADGCTNPSDWSTPIDELSGLTDHSLKSNVDRLHFEAGEDQLWTAWPSTTASGDVLTVLACRARTSTNRCASLTPFQIGSEMDTILKARTVATGNRVGFLATGATQFTQGLYAWSCNLTSSCTLSTHFGYGFRVLDMNPPPETAFAAGWTEGNIHIAIRDDANEALLHARCGGSFTGCAPSRIAPLPYLPRTSYGAGGVDLALPFGDPLIVTERSENEKLVLGPRAATPGITAVVPDFGTGGVSAHWSPRNAEDADGFRVRFGAAPTQTALDQTLTSPDPTSEGVRLSSASGVEHRGTVETILGLDHSAPPLVTRAVGAPAPSLYVDARRRIYASTQACHILVYESSGAVAMRACLRDQACTWGSEMIIEPARGTDAIDSLAASANDTHVYVAYVHATGVREVVVERRPIDASTCALSASTARAVVYTPTASEDPSALSLAATNARVFLAFDRDQSFEPVNTADMQFRSCDTTTACNATGDWTSVNFNHGYYYGQLAVRGTDLYWAAWMRDATTSERSMRVRRCPLSSNCDAAGDFVDDHKVLSHATTSNFDFHADTNGLYLAMPSGRVAWCRDSTCNSGLEWNRGYVMPSLSLDTYVTYFGMLRSHGADLVHVGAADGMIHVARCSSKCWLPDSWVGGVAATDDLIDASTLSSEQPFHAGDVHDGRIFLAIKKGTQLAFWDGAQFDF